MKIRNMLTIALFCVAGAAFGQGSLTPPGAPAPTMKTLDQVEPRMPISSAPYTISQAGSYYLTTNLTCSGHGVVIATSGVTLNLMGFTLSGDRGSYDYGIFLDGATNNPIEQVVVKNGIIRNFGNGLRSEYGQGCRFEYLISDSNRFFGIILTSHSGQCDGNRIANCTINGNGSYGIELSGGWGQCNGNTITDCTITGNGNNGIYLFGYLGQCTGNVITDCTILKNTNRGIYINHSDGNRVEGNHITGQIGASTSGVRISSGSENLIFRNTCVGQTNNFGLGSGNVYGPIVTTAGELPTTGAGAHPLANFSF